MACMLYWSLISATMTYFSAEAAIYCVLPQQLRPPRGCDEVFNLSDCSSLVDNTSNVTIKFYDSEHYIRSVCNVSNASNLIFAPLEDKAVLTCSSGGTTATGPAGLYIGYSENVTIQNLEFRNCGITTYYKKHTNRAALVFRHVKNLKLTGIMIQVPSDAGGFSLNNVHGEVTIRDSRFENARLGREILSGNLLLPVLKSNAPSNVAIINSTFANNSYVCAFSCSINCSSYAAGLAIMITFPGIKASLSRVTFRNNSGCNGGNLAVTYQIRRGSSKYPAEVIVSNGSIIEGGHSNKGGGGILVVKDQTVVNSSFEISDTVITDNKAMFTGGGILVRMAESNKDAFPSVVAISNCHFRNNMLNRTNERSGYALQVSTYISKAYKQTTKLQLSVSISQSSFVDHRQQQSDEENIWSGNAAVYLKHCSLVTLNNVNITDNGCSGMAAEDSNVIIEGAVRIVNNTAYQGAGILLLYNALLYFKVRSMLMVTDNRAYIGGGIYVDSSYSSSYSTCFFQFYASYSRKIKVIVNRNKANDSGDNIFGGSIHKCYLIKSLQDSRYVFYKLFEVPKNSINQSSSISSYPKTIHIHDYHNEYKIWPGQSLRLNVTIYGQENGSTSGTVYAELNDTRVNLRAGDKSQTFKNHNMAKLQFRIYSKKEDIRVSLSLKVSVAGITDPLVRGTKLNLHILQCPVGLKLERKSSIESACRCNYLKSVGSTRSIMCFISSNQRIQYSPKLWIGGISNVSDSNCTSPTIALAIECPQGYCWKGILHLNLKNKPFCRNTDQCYSNRSGILCGKCIEGKSVILGSSECRSCSNYYLTLLLVFALAGPALVLFLSFFNLTVSSATLNGIIFYANIVQMYQSSLFHMQAYLRVFISWLNLDFGISSCFYDGMDGISKAFLQFVFPVYLWIIAGVLIYLSRKLKIVTTIFGNNLVQVLATLILLSFTKLIRAVSDAVQFTKLIFPDSPPHFQSHALRWSIDGNLEFFKGKHILIFTFGILFGVLCLAYTFVLLFIGQLPRISHWPFFSWVYKLKPFFDCYTGPLSTKGLFWVGLLLMVRFFLLVVYSINISSEEFTKMTTTVVAVMVLLLVSLTIPSGIYTKRHLNIIENLSIANIGFLFLALIWNYYYDQTVARKVLSVLSASLCLILFLIVISIHLGQRLGCANAVKWFQKRFHLEGSRPVTLPRNGATSSSLEIPPYDADDRRPLLESLHVIN